jgi:diguanylate cyclase (GGDEF)-like protein/PAS domain S-box-containing protein
VRSRRLIGFYAGWMVALAGAYFAAGDEVPALRTYAWALIGLTSVAAIVVGVVLNRPRRRLPWVLLAAAVAALVIGDTLYSYVTDVQREQDPSPMLADASYFAMYPLLLAGLFLLGPATPRRNRRGLLDAVVVTAGVTLLCWFLLLRPATGPDAAPDGLTQATSFAYPLFDLLFLVTGFRLMTGSRRTPALVAMLVGTLGLFISDVIYGVAQIGDAEWSTGSLVDLGWLTFYLTWGAAALHPSMVSLTEPRLVREAEFTRLRLVLLTLSPLVGPAFLVIEPDHDALTSVFVSAVSAGMFALVLYRLVGVVDVHRQGLSRERGLREAGAALVSATDFDAVRSTVAAAVDDLLPTEHRIVLTIRAVDERRVKGPATPRMQRVEDCEPALAERLVGFDVALVNPLVLLDRPSGDPLVGVLAVAADEASLLQLQASFAVLASQAALAIERITLNNEITRRNSEEYFRTLVQNTADVILIVGDDNRVRYASPSAETVFGPTAVLHRNVRDLVDPRDRDLAWQVLQTVRSGHDGADIADWRVPGDDGLVEVEVSCRDLRRDPTVRGLVLTLRDVTERRRLERELTHRANHDSLTGLANRVVLSDRVQDAVARASRTGAIVALLFVDLDDFKVVNDTLGHEVGDQVLAAVGHRLTAALRVGDTAARLGGDEFAVLIENAHDLSAVEQIADRVVRTLAEPVDVDGNLVTTSASVGVATTIDADGGTDMLRQADLALYVAKGAGKGRWRRYQSVLHTAVMQRLELRSSLDRAVAEGAFALRFQPIVTLGDGATVGFEALVRWRHAARGLILPSDFIDVAEDSGLIVPIGNWVLERALAETTRWPDTSPAYLSVNVSARQFRSPGFLDKVRRELDESGLPPDRLMLEITESLMSDEQVWSDLAALRDGGVRVAIDDFGTGFSALSYLRQVEVDVVKIDKSFVDTIGSSPRQRALMEGILRLAEALGLQVVAEGIERRADLDLLVEVGCPLGQGYLFSQPLSDDEVVATFGTTRPPEPRGRPSQRAGRIGATS